MGPPVDPVTPSATIPQEVDVVVIGGGIVGVMTACFLAEKGISAVLLEKGRDRRRTVQPQLGLVPTQSRDPREIPLAIRAYGLWRGLGHPRRAARPA